MLFSSAEVAKQINDTFEPAWESVRPVPIVTIDFGNGNKVTRTLHGNVATYACEADGRVLDVLPGIYEPTTFKQQLGEFTMLFQYIRRERAEKKSESLKTYHAMHAKALAGIGPRPTFQFMDAGKRKIENPIKLVAGPGPVPAPVPAKDRTPTVLTKREVIAGWNVLADDTRINETVRRRQIHEKLAASDPVKPNEIVKWLYQDVLHADLDDPYLGLGEVLFKNYPFAEEDARR